MRLLLLNDDPPKYPNTKTAFPMRPIPASQTLVFRQTHLWPDKPLSHVKVEGDERALHIGAFDGKILIGVGSFYSQGTKARLRKLAVDPNYQKMGIGSDIVLHGARVMQKNGAGLLWCDARQTARAFYEKLGFDVDAEPFDKSGIAYLVARLSLN